MKNQMWKSQSISDVKLLLLKYSQKSGPQSLQDFFKFYSDDKLEDRYKPLTDKDYNRFISVRASKREPALTRQISKYLHRYYSY